jgi:hypothetical protein
MFDRIENEKHLYHGFDFIHAELSAEPGWARSE